MKVVCFFVQGSSDKIHGTYSKTKGNIIRINVGSIRAKKGLSCKYRVHEK